MESVQRLIQQTSPRWNERAPGPETVGPKEREERKPITQRDAEGVFQQDVALERLPEGSYLLHVSAGDVRRVTWLTVSRIGLVMVADAQKALAYVSDLKTGEPVSGAEVLVSEARRMRGVGRTDGRGLLEIPRSVAAPSGPVLFAARSGRSLAMADMYRGDRFDGDAVRSFVFTDRPVYRPGDEVHFKGIFRRLEGNAYQVPRPQSVEIEVRDPNGELVERSTLSSTASGTFVGKFTTPNEATPGLYEIRGKLAGGEFSKYVSVAVYRKPNYSIAVTPEQPFYIQGQRARVKVKATYYFGAPVPGAKVEAYIQRAPLFAFDGDPELAAEFEGYEGFYGGEFVGSQEAVTDLNGEAILEIDTRELAPKGTSDFDFVYTVNAAVADDAGQYFSGEGRVRVMRGSYALTVETDRYVANPGAPVQVTVRTVDHDGKTPMANVRLRVTTGYQVWDGREALFQPRDRMEAQTGPDGTTTIRVVPDKPGDFQIRVEGEDGRANRISHRAFVWVTGDGSAAGPPGTDLQVQLDQRRYDVGDRAQVLIRTNKPGGSALLTVQAGRILTHRVVELGQSATSVDIPVTEDFVPNVFVSVTRVHDKSLSRVSRRLVVELGTRVLDVSVASDKPAYSPGEVANFTITTKDESGRPVPADVSLAVVDESIFAIFDEKLDIEGAFYPRRWDETQFAYSFPEIYLDGGDKAPTDIQIRRRFRDTAHWEPTVKTGADGTATVSVELPENLTTWRATVVGATEDTAVGIGTHRVRARKDLMVRLQGPAFFVERDEQRLTAMLTNDSGRDADVNVELAAVGASARGNPRQRVFVPAGQTKSVDWTVNLDRAGEARFEARAWIAQGASDGVELKIPVNPYGRDFVDAVSGSAVGTATFQIEVRQGANLDVGRLRLTLAPSLTGPLLESVEGLIGYPYGCVEQTMSRFMPAVLLERGLSSIGAAWPANKPSARTIAAEGYARLGRMQSSDGGWGWWEYGERDTFMTAYVLEGVARATAAGYPAPANMVNRALEWAKQRLNADLPARTLTLSDGKTAPNWQFENETRARAYLAYAVALHGRRADAINGLARLDSAVYGPVEWAHVAMAYRLAGRQTEASAAYARLMALATVGPNDVSWPTQYWGVESTARALTAVQEFEPDSDLVERAVRGMMARRRGGLWWNTRDTSFAIVSLLPYWAKTASFGAAERVTVQVNGRAVRTVDFADTGPAAPAVRIDIPLRELSVGTQRIDLVTSGGACFYSAELKQVVAAERLGPLVTDAGLKVTRQYFRLAPQRMEDGTLRLMPSRRERSEFSEGDLVQCVLTVEAERDWEYLMIEDPIPSSLFVTEREELQDGETWRWWWDRTVIRDDRVAFFVRYLPAGKHRLTYVLRAENRGRASALPTSAMNMYDPMVRTSGAANRIEVVR
ncbi:MAG: MG2 domain-containing protein [Fimbriimonadaceae bacterium]